MSHPNGRQARAKECGSYLLAILVVWFLFGFAEYFFRKNSVPRSLHSAAALSFLVDLVLVGGVVACIGRALTDRFTGIAINGLNQYSLSRAQMAAWTIVVVAALSSFARIRLLSFLGPVADPLQITIPGDLLAAMGIATFSTVATPAVLALKASQTPATGELGAAQRRIEGNGMVANRFNARGKALARVDSSSAIWSDMVLGDELANAGAVDISKVQQILVTVLLVAAYMFAIINALATGHCTPSTDPAIEACPTNVLNALPALSDTFVGLLALSHAGYLAYKIAPKATAPDAQGATPAGDAANAMGTPGPTGPTGATGPT